MIDGGEEFGVLGSESVECDGFFFVYIELEMWYFFGEDDYIVWL